MAAREFTQEELELLRKRLFDDPDSIADFTDEEMIAVRKNMNIFGTGMPEKETWANMSIINWRQNYLEKLIMTGMVGFMFRVCDEYDPDEEIEMIESGPGTEAAKKAKVESVTKSARNLIRRFLMRNLEFNPDRHVRLAKSVPESDPERQSALDKIKAEAALPLPAIEADGGQKLFEYLKSTTKYLYEQCDKMTNVVHKLSQQLQKINEDAACVVQGQHMKLCSIREDLARLAKPFSAADTAAALQYSPPADTFHNFRRYFDEHYSQLVLIVQALYSVKPDIEFAIKLYGAWDSSNAAKADYQKHAKEYTSDVLTIQTGGITLLGPYKENMERVDYYTQNTEILKIMDEHAKRDAELGKDMIKKQVFRQKEKSVKKNGPDHPELNRYATTAGATNAGKRPLTSQELEDINKIRTDIADAIVPDDAIQINQYHTSYDADGKATFTKETIYTQAEEPLHLAKDSPYANQYQPIKTKTLLSRKNQKKTTAELGKSSQNVTTKAVGLKTRKTLAELVDDAE